MERCGRGITGALTPTKSGRYRAVYHFGQSHLGLKSWQLCTTVMPKARSTKATRHQFIFFIAETSFTFRVCLDFGFSGEGRQVFFNHGKSLRCKRVQSQPTGGGQAR
jgi:hypothetical protein